MADDIPDVFCDPARGEYFVRAQSSEAPSFRWLHIYPDGRTAWGDPDVYPDLVRLGPIDAARAEVDSDRRAYLVQVERLIAERNAARADAEQIAQDYDVLKREYRVIVPPTARAAGKNRPKDDDHG